MWKSIYIIAKEIVIIQALITVLWLAAKPLEFQIGLEITVGFLLNPA